MFKGIKKNKYSIRHNIEMFKYGYVIGNGY